jgi:hypothetical protein
VCAVSLKILCSGYLVRYPLGGFAWHHFQYLLGLSRLGHEVAYVEDYGWPDSCYDPSRAAMTGDPGYGVAFLVDLLRPHGLAERWCFLAQDGRAHGMAREDLAEFCEECDLYLNLSNINWIPEFERCRRRVLVDTDPVFTQIDAHGFGGPFSRYHELFTFGENVHRPESEMPTAGARWLPTRQPIVLDLWTVSAPDAARPFSTVINWSSFEDVEYEGNVYGQRAREFGPFFTLPRDTRQPMEIAVNAPEEVRAALERGGWRLVDAHRITRTPSTYQRYLSESRAEFGVAKHGYVTARCGWFSDRSAAYLASGRPVVTQDTGFSDFLPCGSGLLYYRTRGEAVAAIERLRNDYPAHCRDARSVAEECFDSRRVLAELLERAL